MQHWGVVKTQSPQCVARGLCLDRAFIRDSADMDVHPWGLGLKTEWLFTFCFYLRTLLFHNSYLPPFPTLNLTSVHGSRNSKHSWRFSELPLLSGRLGLFASQKRKFLPCMFLRKTSSLSQTHFLYLRSNAGVRTKQGSTSDFAQSPFRSCWWLRGLWQLAWFMGACKAQVSITLDNISQHFSLMNIMLFVRLFC